MVNDNVDVFEFDQVTKELLSFFQARGWVQAYGQNRRSIMAACEDPTTMATYNYSGTVWPLPQTNQMHLEHFLLDHLQKNPSFGAGMVCQTTSYRQEPNPVDGRHNLIFPMFEFEACGTMEDLLQLEGDLLRHLGYNTANNNCLDVQSISGYPEFDYEYLSDKYNVHELDHSHENKMLEDYGHAAFIKNFPEHTYPFWNMARKDGTARKVDVILSGIETIGSAERSCDVEQMRRNFYNISDGKYAERLFSEFTKERVVKELDDFLAKDFKPRFGGGIGVTRLIRSLKLLRGGSM